MGVPRQPLEPAACSAFYFPGICKSAEPAAPADQASASNFVEMPKKQAAARPGPPLIPWHSRRWKPSVRHHSVAADVHAGGFERTVRLLCRADDRNRGAGLEFAALADHVLLDRKIRR